MAYRFERGETVPEGTRRITIEQIHRALNHLGDADGDREEHIHESRKCMKRLRGLVRLVRAELGDETYRRENECFRDVSSILAGMRNAAALIEALDELLAWLGPRTPRSRFDNIRRWLIGRRDEAYGQSRPVDVRVEERAMSALSDAEKRLGSWSFSRDGFEALERGLRQVYARGRKGIRRGAVETGLPPSCTSGASASNISGTTPRFCGIPGPRSWRWQRKSWINSEICSARITISPSCRRP